MFQDVCKCIHYFFSASWFWFSHTGEVHPLYLGRAVQHLLQWQWDIVLWNWHVFSFITNHFENGSIPLMKTLQSILIDKTFISNSCRYIVFLIGCRDMDIKGGKNVFKRSKSIIVFFTFVLFVFFVFNFRKSCSVTVSVPKVRDWNWKLIFSFN